MPHYLEEGACFELLMAHAGRCRTELSELLWVDDASVKWAAGAGGQAKTSCSCTASLLTAREDNRDYILKINTLNFQSEQLLGYSLPTQEMAGVNLN